MKPGMLGAVEYGTARRAAYDPNEPIFGKTGTCTDRATPTHLGWFGSFNDVGNKKLVVVVLADGRTSCQRTCRLGRCGSGLSKSVTAAVLRQEDDFPGCPRLRRLLVSLLNDQMRPSGFGSASVLFVPAIVVHRFSLQRIS